MLRKNNLLPLNTIFEKELAVALLVDIDEWAFLHYEKQLKTSLLKKVHLIQILLLINSVICYKAASKEHRIDQMES